MSTITKMAVTAAPAAGRSCSTVRPSSTPVPVGRASPSRLSPTRSSSDRTRATAWSAPRSCAAPAAATLATCSTTAPDRPASGTASIRFRSTSRRLRTRASPAGRLSELSSPVGPLALGCDPQQHPLGLYGVGVVGLARVLEAELVDARPRLWTGHLFHHRAPDLAVVVGVV